MPTFTYIPRRSVIPAHMNAFQTLNPVRIYTTDVTSLSDRLITDRQTKRNLSGNRRKTIKSGEELCVDISITNIDVTERPLWLEFFRSVNCGEKFDADLCDIPGFSHPVDSSTASISEDEDWNRVGGHSYNVSFEICFAQMRKVL